MKRKMCQFLSIAVLIATALCLHTNDAFAVDVWYTVFGKPFVQGFYGENQVLAMVEFGGTIYVGTGQDDSSTHSANVYRLVHAGCKLWECFTPPWSWYTGSGSEPYAMAMIVFNYKLYVGTDQGEVWRTDGLKWTNWENVTGSWSKDAITDMAEFDGYLYISFSGVKVWRTKDGSSWQPVPGVGAADPYSYDLNSLEVFGNHLYAGVGRKKWVDGPYGHYVAAIALWRMDKNGNWTMFKSIDFPDGTAILKQPSHVNALKTFKNHLYLGEYHLPLPDGGGLYRTNGSVTSWEWIDANVNGTGVYRLEEHSGKLYLGMNDFTGMYNWVGEPLLYSSTDGLSWSQVSGGPVVGSNTVAITSMLSCKGTLYVGYWNAMSSSGTLLISALGSAPAPTCQIEAAEKGVGVVTAKIVGIIDPIYRIYPRLPDLRVLPPIGPRPPPPDGDEWDEWTFLLVTDLIDAVDGIEVSPEAEELKELVLGDLEIVNAEVGLAMSILYEATSGIDGDLLRTFDLSDVLDEVLSHLEHALELCQEISTLLPFLRARYIDIKPSSWPNPLQLNGKGVLPVAICGTEDFDVTTIDPATVQLTLEGLGIGVPPLRWSYKDVATPYMGDPFGGHDLGADGYLDLTLKFKTQEVIQTLGLDAFSDGDVVILLLTGNLKAEFDGTAIHGQDCVWILHK